MCLLGMGMAETEESARAARARGAKENIVWKESSGVGGLEGGLKKEPEDREKGEQLGG